MAADVWADLDTVPWERLHHAYGPATDVPDQLRALRSPNPEARRQAMNALGGNVYHQGTRWQASAHVVQFLVALVDDAHMTGRASIVGLLAAIGIGDLRDDELPFDPAHSFADGANVTGAQVDEVVHGVYYGEDPFADEDFTELAEKVAVRWTSDAYAAAAAYQPRFVAWVTDPDEDVAAEAAALLAWFSPTDDGTTALLSVPVERAGVRAAANLTLAHATDGRADVVEHLVEQLSAERTVAVTAAVALAYRCGGDLPEPALTRLVDAYAASDLGGVPAWDRALRGFVALALQRLGLI